MRPRSRTFRRCASPSTRNLPTGTRRSPPTTRSRSSHPSRAAEGRSPSALLAVAAPLHAFVVDDLGDAALVGGGLHRAPLLDLGRAPVEIALDVLGRRVFLGPLLECRRGRLA